MIEVRQTVVFETWFSRLRDGRAKARIVERIYRVSLENFGDVRPVGEGVSELRIPYGPGYRLYIAKRGLEIVVLLCGGDKSTQAKDIKAAHKLAKEV